MEIYDLEARTPAGEVLPMARFKGKALLLVNTATRCGLAPQLRELEGLHKKYHERGLVVIGFPCNQFRHQEPESNETVENACAINFGVTFQLTEKIDVNGKHAHPVFEFLKNRLPGFPGKKIKWNYTKFLVSASGVPYKRFGPYVKPYSFEKDILDILPESPVEMRRNLK